MKGNWKIGQGGFSFLEGVFAITLLSFGMVFLLTLFCEMDRATADDEFTLNGSQLASQKIEQILAQKAAGGYASVPLGVAVENIEYNAHAFTRETSVRWVNASDLRTVSEADTGLKRVDVTVQWSNGAGQRVQMMGLVSNY